MPYTSIGTIAELADHLLDQFMAGLGGFCESTLFDEMAPTPYTIYFIPERLCNSEKNGLIIVVKGVGSFIWDGKERLNKFKLVTSGIPSLGLCESLVQLTNEISLRVKSVQDSKKQSVPEQKALAAPNQEKTNG